MWPRASCARLMSKLASSGSLLPIITFTLHTYYVVVVVLPMALSIESIHIWRLFYLLPTSKVRKHWLLGDT